jgi:glycosyltransferase involved in cell wall biosynthesis
VTAAAPVGDLVILTPLYEPAVGGAAVYYPLLARTLLDAGIADRVTVITERHPRRPARDAARDGRLAIRRLLPYRAGCPKRQRTRHLRYAVANLAYTHLLRRAWPAASALLVHASLQYHPGLLTAVLTALRRRPARPRLVADVRDPRFPPAREGCLQPYDAVIACAERVTDHLGAMPVAAPKLKEIPVPMALPDAPADPAPLARRHGLRPGADILWPHGALDRKGIRSALAAVAHLRAHGQPDARLAIAGGTRDWGRDLDAAVAAGGAIALGPVAHDAMPALMRAAAGVVDIAAVEGMPRAMLEAMAVGARVLLPPGVPEFARYCPGHLAATGGPEALAAQLARMRTGPWARAPYPVTAHAADRVAAGYGAVLAPAPDDATGPRCAS